MIRLDVELALAGARIEVRALVLEERLGVVTRAEIEGFSTEPIKASAVVGKAAALRLASDLGARDVHGVVTSFTQVGTSQSTPARRVRLVVESALAILGKRLRTMVFQHLSVPDIIAKVCTAAGLPPELLERRLSSDYAERVYCVQYAETDLQFIRRLCEEDGLYFHFEPRDGQDALVLEDDLKNGLPALEVPIQVATAAGLDVKVPVAFDVHCRRSRRPGKLTGRDHDFARPNLLLEETSKGGDKHEQDLEVYCAPLLKDTASRRLESIRADAEVITFQSNAVEVRPGRTVDLDGQHLGVIATALRWSSSEFSMRVEAVPGAYRLPIVTKKPHIAGVHTAVVTGAKGEEIHADAAGRIRLRFPWDCEGPVDDKSSLPVRVVQPNLPGSMLIPRVGWEVFVAFEHGDPDKPFVLGRVYNAKQTPPFALPVNKAMTSIGTLSSPGAGAKNAVHFDDSAGAEHFVVHAGKGLTTTVGTNRATMTIGFEETKIKGSQTFQVGGTQKISVKNASMTEVGSQSGAVGGTQSVFVTANMTLTTGAKSVSVAAILDEKVGNPADGLLQLGSAAAIAAAGHIPGVGPYLAPALSVGAAAGMAALHGQDVKTATYDALAGVGAGHIPGGDALMAAASDAGVLPWTPKPSTEKNGKKTDGGGGGGPGGTAAAAGGPGPGFRITTVGGSMMEGIGGAYIGVTPGSIKCTTLGPSINIIGGSHSTKAAIVSSMHAVSSVDEAATFTVNASASIGKCARLHSVNVSGAYSSSAAATHDIKGTSVTFDVSGDMSISGGLVAFNCGGAGIVVASAGLLLEATKLTVDDNWNLDSGSDNN